MKRVIFFILIAALLLLPLSCKKVQTHPETLGPVDLTYQFTPGQRFETYDFTKHLVVMPDGTHNDTREVLVSQFEVWDVGANGRMVLWHQTPQIEIARFQKKDFLGSITARKGTGIISVEKDPGIDRDALLDRVEKSRAIAITPKGRILSAIEIGVDADPLDIEKWPKPLNESGPVYFKDAVFGVILPDQPVTTGSHWTKTYYARLAQSDSAMEIEMKYEAQQLSGPLFQITGYGTNTGQTIGDDILEPKASLMCQTTFHADLHFILQHKCEINLEYLLPSKKRIKEVIKSITNNTIVKRH